MVQEQQQRPLFLLVATGAQLSDEDATKYGVKAKAEPEANKNKPGPAENKASK